MTAQSIWVESRLPVRFAGASRRLADCRLFVLAVYRERWQLAMMDERKLDEIGIDRDDADRESRRLMW